MNDKQICFIACVNNDDYEREMRYYIERLQVPQGYEIQIQTVKGAASMCAGYNMAMNASDATIKVYLHQDVYIVNRYFISDLLELLSADSKIGMVGMIGAPHMPENMIMWGAPRVGCAYTQTPYSSGAGMAGAVEGTWREVEAVDGFLMATRVDIPWCEDILDGWDFYDVAQCKSMREAGYKIVVPRQDEPWCIHDDGFMNLKNYYGYRKKYLEWSAE